jgi:biopolymer transport protein ExbB
MITTATLLFPCTLFGADAPTGSSNSTLDLAKVFEGSPYISTTLLTLSLFAFVLWLYSHLTLRVKDMMPKQFVNTLREQLAEQRYEAALVTCQKEKNFASNIIASGLAARRHGSQVMIEAMQSEGRRAGMALWQRISLLNDVAVIAPMLGLLGTVLGMFFAFYDTSQSAENLATIFDGLGIAIGTTVAGLVVAILAMFFYTSLRFRVINLLNLIENEAHSIANLIDLNQNNTP